jgi:hypothetical protein
MCVCACAHVCLGYDATYDMKGQICIYLTYLLIIC